MEEKDKLMRAADGGIVYMLCLLQMGLLGSLLVRVLGVYGILLCELLSIAIVVGAARLTRLKASAYLKFGRPSARQICGAAMLYASAMLVSVVLILFGHLIFPNFAASGFHIVDCKYYSIPSLLAILILSAIADTLLLDGYLYSRFRYLAPAARVAAIAAAFAVYHLEMYLLLPLAAVQVAIVAIRSRTDSMLVPLVLHLLTGAISIALLQMPTGSNGALMGIEMGGTQVIGLALIFLGAAIPVMIVGNILLAAGKKPTPLFTLILLAAALVLVSAGCGVSGM